MGFSPFAIDSLGRSRFLGTTTTEPGDLPLAASYETLAQLAPLILEHQGKGTMAGVVLGANDEPRKISLGDYTLEVSYPRSRRPPTSAPASSQRPDLAGALFISMGPDEYLATGNGSLSVTFSPNTPGPPVAGIAYIDEGTFVNGNWVPGRRLNGDENDQGRMLRLSSFGTGSIQRVKLYRYR